MLIEPIQPPLDNSCLTFTQSPIKTLYKSEYDKAFLLINQHKKLQKQRQETYFKQLIDENTKASHLKRLVNFQRLNAPNKTMRECNTTPIAVIRNDSTQKMSIEINEYTYSMSGLNRCKNPFCVMCSKSKAGQRAHRIKNGIDGAFEKGLGVYFVTFTIPRQQCILEARKEITERWRHMSKLFTRWKRQTGITTHYARALDVTFKKYIYKQRYHLHIHTVIVVDDVNLLKHYNKGLKPKQRHTIESLLINQWLGLNRVGMRCREVSQDIQKVTNTEQDTGRVSRYCGKMAGLALELSNGTMKHSNSNSSLSDLMLENTPKTIEIYKEYLQGMRKSRTLQFSRYWDDLIDDEEAEELDVFSVDIPLDKWRIVKPIWLDLADKLQFELFTLSKTAQGETDYNRQSLIIKEVNWFIQNADSTEYLELFLTVDTLVF